MKKTIPLSFLVSFIFLGSIHAQVFTDKPLSEKRKAYADSIEQAGYPYLLPIWGEKVIEKGYDIPYSAGISVNYLTQKSDLVIENLKVGFNNGELFELDDIIRFNEATVEASVISIRPDVWVLPFLNVYGIFARVETSTDVDVSVVLPNQDGFEEIFNLTTTAEFSGTTAGFGFTPTIGVGGGWIALDMNFSWTDIPELDEPAYSFVFGPRIGKTFHFKKPEQNIAVWVGGFRIDIASDTAGDLAFADLFEFDGSFEQKIDNGLVSVVEKQQELDTWFEGLSPTQQTVNGPKYEALTAILGKANQFLSGLDQARENATNSTVQYEIDKSQKERWNFLIGAQYQLNKHFMVRGEIGFLATRTQGLFGLQYRFKL